MSEVYEIEHEDEPTWASDLYPVRFKTELVVRVGLGSAPTASDKSKSCSDVEALGKVRTVRRSCSTQAAASAAAVWSTGSPCPSGACHSSASPLKPISCRTILCAARTVPSSWSEPAGEKSPVVARARRAWCPVAWRSS